MDTDKNQSADNKVVEVLCVVALSGAIPASRVELLCWSVCNVCRQYASWSVRVINPELDRFNCFGRYLFPKLEEPAPPPPIGTAYFDNGLFTTAAAIAIASSSLTGHNGNSSPTANADGQPARAIPRHRNIKRLMYLSTTPLSANVQWPRTLRALSFGWMFNRPLDSSSLPQTLLELDLGGGFNHQIDHITWPPGLLKLRIGTRFNRPIELATWPVGLQTLEFGNEFNQPIEDVVWPPGLKHLVFGNAFDQPIGRAKWAATTIRFVQFSLFDGGGIFR